RARAPPHLPAPVHPRELSARRDAIHAARAELRLPPVRAAEPPALRAPRNDSAAATSAAGAPARATGASARGSAARATGAHAAGAARRAPLLAPIWGSSRRTRAAC